MSTKYIKSDLLLLLTGAIWGLAFVAQRIGMEHIGPHLFNGLRFGLGSLFLLPFLFSKTKRNTKNRTPHAIKTENKYILLGGSIVGIILFIAAALQQIGMIYTTAGNGGFITGLYVILVPIFGLLIKQKTNLGTWTGTILAVIGLYFLSVTDQLSISKGDLFVFSSAIFWAIHVLTISWLAPKVESLKLAIFQFSICAVLSLITAIITEEIELNSIIEATPAILYGGIMSVGVAYTLQIVAQKKAPPAHAAILLSLEGVFAVIGGLLVLGETMSLRGYIGCLLILTGMLLSQLYTFIKKLRIDKKTT